MNSTSLNLKTVGRQQSLGILLSMTLALLFSLGVVGQSFGAQAGQDSRHDANSARQVEETKQTEDVTTDKEDFKTQLDKLVEEFDPKMKKWSADYRKASRAERTELLKTKVSGTYGNKLLELFDAHADEDAARLALEKAITLGDMKIKTKSAEKLFELAGTQSAEIAEETYVLIARRGWGEIKMKAVRVLLERAKSETDEKVAIRYLEHVLYTNVGGDEIATEAGEFFWNKIKDDLESENAASVLILLGQRCKGDVRDNALDAMLEHYPNSPELAKYVEKLPQQPSAICERVLEALCKNENELTRMRAAVALSKYYRLRDSHKGYLEGDKQKEIKKLGQPQYDYLTLPADPKEMETLKTVLQSKFNGDKELAAQVKEQLFVVDNLSTGSTAMEILGKDLDGKEFRLSDYKGKVVFLDFWGDW